MKKFHVLTLRDPWSTSALHFFGAILESFLLTTKGGRRVLLFSRLSKEKDVERESGTDQLQKERTIGGRTALAPEATELHKQSSRTPAPGDFIF